MLIEQRHAYEECIYLDQDGYVCARYQDLFLSSVFQPIVNQEERVIGHEALVRIHREDGSFVPPDVFFQDTERESDDIINVDRLSRVIHIRNYIRADQQYGLLFLNMLPCVGERYFCADMTSNLLSIRLKELGFDTKRIVMEVTEYASNSELRLMQATQKFQRAHFKVAIDDFGSKYSSEERVNAIHPDIIKFDRSLICDYVDGNKEPLEKAVMLAKQAGVTMVQEGIETSEHFIAAKQLGIHWLQGYYFQKPMPLLSYSSNSKSNIIVNL